LLRFAPRLNASVMRWHIWHDRQRLRGMDRLREQRCGRAAALAGVLFVGLSLNLSEVLKYPGVPARAIATLGLTVAVLLTTIFVATPGQDSRVLAAEIALIGVAAMVIVGAVSLWMQRGAGRYWVTASVVTGFVSATANARVLLVEIKREVSGLARAAPPQR
jgi:hypothetical protein